MKPLRNHQIQSVFAPGLASEARLLAESHRHVRIIPLKDFPAGAPIHEDGSSEYDPKKPLAYFAIELRSQHAIDRWTAICNWVEAKALAAAA